MQLQVFPPHPKLAHLLMHIMVLELDGCESHMCAALSPAFMLLIRGSVDVIEDDGSLSRYPRFTLRGPRMTPTRWIAAPGTLLMTVCFRPGMLQKGLGLSVEGLTSRELMPAEIVGASRVDQLLRAMDEERTVVEYVQAFQDFLLDTLDLTRKPHIGEAFLAAHQKMFFPLVDLAAYFGIGQRQLERRVLQAFGVSLRDMRRITRFGLCLPRIIGQPVGWGDLTRIAQESGYYDQAHMHREFVELAGIGPVQLLQKIAGNDPAYWVYRMSETDFKNLFLPVH